MQEAWEFLKDLTNPESIIRYGGLALLVFVIFAETGLMVGFFLPGDSLVFIAGLICATEPDLMGADIVTVVSSLTGAAIAGNLTGYFFGRKIGPALFTKDDNLIFKRKYIDVTRSFYDRHGGKSLIMGRFLPIVRTFAPILAGVIRMSFITFLLHTVIGGVLWIGSLSVAGYFLGEIPWVKQNIEWIVIGLIVLTTIPLITTWRQESRRKS